MLEKIKETVDFLKSKIDIHTSIGIVLGTGLGNLAEQITDKKEIPYNTIPNFPVSTINLLSDFNFLIKYSYNGMAISGRAA